MALFYSTSMGRTLYSNVPVYSMMLYHLCTAPILANTTYLGSKADRDKHPLHRGHSLWWQMWEMTDSLKSGSLLGHEFWNPIYSRLMETRGWSGCIKAGETGLSEIRRWKDSIANVTLPARLSTFSANYRGKKGRSHQMRCPHRGSLSLRKPG